MYPRGSHRRGKMHVDFMNDILDKPDELRSCDSENMTGAIMALPEQCERALEIGEGAPLPVLARRPSNVLILGLGGSAIGGDLLRTLLADEVEIPVVVNREYDIPAFAGRDTLVIASSYSGNTEETLTAYSQARARGSQLMAITTGGKLKEIAQRDGVPVIEIPGGLQPRAAIGYSFLPLLVAFWRLGLVRDKRGDVEEMIALLKKMRGDLGPERPGERNRAKEIADRIYGKLPVVYGSYGWKGAVALRWKTQINENSKGPCYYNFFPELNHNEIVGTEAPQALLKEVEIIILRDEADPPRIRKRIGVTEAILRERVGGITEVWAEGRSPLARLFSLLYIGDFVSLYLAILNGIDPSPVRVISYLKNELAKEEAIPQKR